MPALVPDSSDRPMLVLNTGGHTATVWKALFTPDGKQVITVSADKTIRFWDAVNGAPLRVLRPPSGIGDEGGLYGAAISPDGATLAVGGYGFDPFDHRIYLISIGTGQITTVLQGHDKWLAGLAFSPDGKRLASADCDFSPEGKRLASGDTDRVIRIWDVAAGQCERALRGHADRIYGVAFSPDGQTLASVSDDRTVMLWDVATGQRRAAPKEHTAPVRCVAWSPDGQTLATGSYDHTIRLWDKDGRYRGPFANLGEAVSSIGFTPDSRRLLATGKAARGSAVLDVQTGQELASFRRQVNTVMTGALSPDGALAATGNCVGEVFLWRTADASLHAISVGKGQNVYSAAWSGDGKSIAWGKAWGGEDLSPGNAPLDRSFCISDLEFDEPPGPSARRAQLAFDTLAAVRTSYTTLAVTENGKTLAQHTLESANDYLRSFTFLGADLAAVGSMYGLALINPRTGERLRALPGPTGEVWAVAPSPDNRYLLSVSGDQTIMIWDVAGGALILSLFVAGVEWIAWTPQGHYACSPGGENLMGWQVGNGKERMAAFHPAAHFRSSLYQPDVIRRILETSVVEKAYTVAPPSVDVSRVLPPSVAILAPSEPNLSIPDGKVVVQAIAISVGAEPVTALRLLVDGRPHAGEGGLKKVAEPKLGKVRESWSVQIAPGNHKLAVQAESAVSYAVSDPVDVSCGGARTLGASPEEGAPSAEPAANLFVLAIGISAYPGPLTLRYAAKDAEALARTYQERSRSLFSKVEVKLLTDAQATRAAILRELGSLRKRMTTENDVAAVSFAGHGALENGLFYLVPVDGDSRELSVTGVSGSDFQNHLTTIPGKVILMLDACHAAAVQGGAPRPAVSLTDDLVRNLVSSQAGVRVMCAAMRREYAIESPKIEHGFFTYALMEGLSGKADFNRDGVVHIDELGTYVHHRVRELADNQQSPVFDPASLPPFPLSRP